MSNLFKLIETCLKATISKDETRLNLNGVYFDPSKQQAVSTNGYAMTFSKRFYDNDFANKIVDFKNMTTIKKEFLKYAAVIPKKFNNTEMVMLGKNLDIKQKRPEFKAYFVKGKGFTIEKDFNGEFDFVLDPKYLKPLIGNNLEVKYNGPLQPVQFTLLEDDSYYIVMPMRA